MPITVSNPDKVFWPEEGYTKLDLVEYYNAIFPKLSPYVKDRMLSLERCPDGMRGECFFQKQNTHGDACRNADQADRACRPMTGKFTDYVVGGSLITQLALVNLGCIAVHVMASRANSPRQPDWICIDIDPESGKFARCRPRGIARQRGIGCLEARVFREDFGRPGHACFGADPAGPDADEVLAFAESFVERVAAAHPDELTVEHSVAARGDRVYLDPFRNGFGQTVVAPYSVRRREKAPVSTPLEWSEIKPNLSPSTFNIANFAKRLKGTDPWRGFFKNRQALKDAARMLNKV